MADSEFDAAAFFPTAHSAVSSPRELGQVTVEDVTKTGMPSLCPHQTPYAPWALLPSHSRQLWRTGSGSFQPSTVAARHGVHVTARIGAQNRKMSKAAWGCLNHISRCSQYCTS